MKMYNDNELLYYCSEHDEFALNIIIEKYKPLIASRLKKYNIKKNNFEDFFQECLMVLYKCVLKFRPDKDISFNSYVETSINYCIRNNLKKEKEYFYNISLVGNEVLDLYSKNDDRISKEENIHFDLFYCDNKLVNISNNKQSVGKYNFSEYEIKVLKYLNEGCDIRYICQSLNKPIKSVYNTISRIKAKDPDFNKRENSDLSNLEYDVYKYYKCGYRAKEISSILSLDVNIIYNALKRIKKKIK